MLQRSRAHLRRLPSGEEVWVEEVTSALGQRYLLVTSYPRGFPRVCPIVHVLSPDVAGAPHRFSDGSLCLFDDHVGGIGPSTSAATVRARAVVWIFLYEAWLSTGVWPQPETGAR